MTPGRAAAATCPKGTKQERLQVRKGETLADFAARAGVEAADVKAWNRMTTDGVWAGRSLAVCRAKGAGGSVGTPSNGKLVGGRSIDPDGDRKGFGFVIGEGRTRLFGTPTAIAGVKNCVAQYRGTFPKGKGPPVNIGDLSARHGGPAGPHVSHESGRDVDLGYLTKPPQSRGVFDREATSENLDVAKQWALTECFVNPNKSPSVKIIFIGREVAQALRAHVEKVYKKNGPVRRRYLAWLDKRLSPDSEHLTHMHVRFKCAPSDKKCVD